MAGQSTEASGRTVALSWAALPWVTCFPATGLLSSDTGGLAPSFPGGSTVELVALWLEMMTKDGKLIWMRRGWRKGGPWGALAPLWEGQDLEMAQGLPQQPSCSAKWMDWEGSS